MKSKPTYEELERRVAELEGEAGASDSMREMMQEQLHFLQTLIDTIPNPVFYKDASGLYQGCNRSFEARIGLKKEDIIGKRATDLFPHDLAEKYELMDMALLRCPGTQVHETTLLYADGTLRDVIINKGTFLNVDGKVGGLVGVTEDITERKQARDALQEAHDELEMRVRERTVELARTNEDLRTEIAERERVENALRESSEKLKLFAYSILHDLKSPSIAIHGLTRLLRRQYADLLDEKGRKYCEQIIKGAEQIAAFVEKMNSYIATREVRLTIEEVDVKEILAAIREEFAVVLQARGIRWIEPGEPVVVRADRLSVLRVFRNFIDNALKYGGNALSEIRVDYALSGGFHVFSVSDDGAGIGVGDRGDTVFGVFQRSAGSRGVEGAGLGLAIVKEIAGQHGGRVWVEPRAEGGTTFNISFAVDL